jgi:hypothetical protein
LRWIGDSADSYLKTACGDRTPKQPSLLELRLVLDSERVVLRLVGFKGDALIGIVDRAVE